ncbi:M24 family metallopeptidase [Metabacillus bambusae]|uniref:Aminopeptidase P family protein n=1 Tax=Metabacillus bambusae TaxID=2795218 RepID=A0ABS3N930_9BACI|nr:Xaa-Pro peptidase family protein [Metabacillus bambusae]MBO1514494.1 aminopeptidase P family protein [Metabacillus bambusae]
MQKRLTKLTNWLKENEIDMCFIQSKENVFYLTNFYTDPHERLMGLFLFKNTEPFFVCPQMEASQAKDAGWDYQIVGYGDHENPWDLIQQIVIKQKLSIQTLAIEKEVTSYSRVESLLQIIKPGQVVPVENILNELRVIKDEKEVSILKQAAELADYGVQVGINALKDGVSEMEVLATIEYELKKKGIREMSFSTMVLFGEKSGQPHGNPGGKMLSDGDFVLFDLGVILDGYCSDITRTFVYKSHTEQQRQIYETVLKAQLAALQASKAGNRIGELDSLARAIITDAGYGDYFPHRLGHGLGINVHEYPSMSHTNDEVLKEGMVYTIEPGIYIPTIGGVRIEDDVLITKNGFETLTKFSKEFTIIK